MEWPSYVFLHLLFHLPFKIQLREHLLQKTCPNFRSPSALLCSLMSLFYLTCHRAIWLRCLWFSLDWKCLWSRGLSFFFCPFLSPPGRTWSDIKPICSYMFICVNETQFNRSQFLWLSLLWAPYIVFSNSLSRVEWFVPFLPMNQRADPGFPWSAA
jgi:hypothetical protein